MSNSVERVAVRKSAADELAARFQILEPRWEKKKRRPKHFSWERQRLRDLQIILQDRYPDGVPDHINIDALVKTKAQVLGDSLGLTAAERTMMKITTIRPCDATIEELRKAKKRERDRKRHRQQRQYRAAYLAANTLSQTRPWEAEGISRRTWERRRNRRAASPSPTTYSSMGDDALASSDRPLASHADPGPDNARAFPFAMSLGYLLRLYEYRQLTRGGIVKAVPGLAACSELRRVAA